MPAPVSLVDLDPDFFCSPSRSQWLREYRLALPWTQAQLADACGVSRSTVVRWENDQVPVPKYAVMVLFLANVINDSGDSSLQMMTWPERERNRWRRFLSTKNHPVDIVAFAELRWLLDVPDPAMPTKEKNNLLPSLLVPCSYEEYIEASEGSLPDRWWRTYQKLA